MYIRHGILILALWLTAVSTGAAVDTVRLGKTSLTGQITGMTAEKITLNRRGVEEDIPANRISSLLLEGEPADLNLARVAATNGRYEDAAKMLAKIEPAQATGGPYVAQEIEFYKALCAARLALRGTGAIRDAGSQMARFVAARRDSYHWFTANELVGDLLVANGQFADAAKYYAVVESAPWPEYRTRAEVALGRALLAEGKPAEAMTAFDKALAAAPADAQDPAIRPLAQLGKARCMAAQGQTDEAIALIQEIIAKADPENTLLGAQAYNALGAALRRAGKTQDALLAFLHVHLLYFHNGEEHAEALFNLAELFNQVHQPQRAAEIHELLNERYKNSRWASS